MQFYTTHLGTRTSCEAWRTRYDRIKCYMTKAHTKGGPCRACKPQDTHTQVHHQLITHYESRGASHGVKWVQTRGRASDYQRKYGTRADGERLQSTSVPSHVPVLHIHAPGARGRSLAARARRGRGEPRRLSQGSASLPLTT